jgi:flagellar P-ring protein precursor FlgI
LAEGRIHLDDPDHPTEGSIHKGCRLEQDIFNAFQKNGKITLVLDRNHADFQVATAVAQAINTQLGWKGARQSEASAMARAINSANIVVEIPESYADAPVQFVAQVMDLPLFELETEARVVINERAGTIVIGGNVEIGPAVITHKNITIETTNEQPGAKFLEIDPGQTNAPKLKTLVEALNAIKVPTEDIIDIIKGLERDGKLHGRLIIE